MSEDKRLLKVFLSHAHADREAVKALYDRLTADGVDAWLDKEKLLPGQDWEREIRAAVREADVVVVCLSCKFSEKGFRQKEVRIALEEAALQPEGEIFIIPARLEECDTLESLRKWHWVDLFEPDGYEYLMRALRMRADNIGATLQIKRSWLPNITAPRSKRERPATEKKPPAPKPKEPAREEPAITKDERKKKSAGQVKENLALKFAPILRAITEFLKKYPKNISLVFVAALFLIAVVFLFYSRIINPSLLFLCNSEGRISVCEYTFRKEKAEVLSVLDDATNWLPVKGPQGNIYYTSTRDGKAEIYRLKSNGDVERVTNTPGNYKSWSPVIGLGGDIYFTSNRDGKTEIYRLQKNGAVERVTNTPEDYISWSPAVRYDGVLYFTSNRDGKSEIYRLSKNNVERVTNTPGRFVSWSPAVGYDGVLYFTSNRDGKSEIYRLKSYGGVERATNTPEQSISWSPVIRGSYIYFTSNRSGQKEVYVLKPQVLPISDLESWTSISESNSFYK